MEPTIIVYNDRVYVYVSDTSLKVMEVIVRCMKTSGFVYASCQLLFTNCAGPPQHLRDAEPYLFHSERVKVSYCPLHAYSECHLQYLED